jgi:Cysteine-rich CWC
VNGGGSPASERCPRCGGVFRCGAAGPGPCACTMPRLSAELLGHLRDRYTSCLCLSCLRALAQAERASPRAGQDGP